MPDQDSEPRDIRNEATEARLQADPILRRGRAPYAWPLAIAFAVLTIAIVLFATNQDDSEVVEADQPAATTGAAPDRAPPERSTTGANQ